MIDLELKKLKAELLRIQASRAEMEYIIAQRMVEVERLQDNIRKQEEAERLLLEKMDGGK